MNVPQSRAHVENTLSPYDLVLDFGCKRSSKEFEQSVLEWFWYWSNLTKYRGPRPIIKVAWTQHGRKSEANEVLPEVDLYDQTFEHQFQNELPPSVAVEVFSDDIWVIHKKESYSNRI